MPKLTLPTAAGSGDSWQATLHAVEALLPFWDAWCPDDGRPAAALALIRQYLQDPSAVALARLQAARAAVNAATEMACQQPLTAENWVAPSLAWPAIRPVVYLLDALLAPSPRVARYWRTEALAVAATLSEQRWRLALAARGPSGVPSRLATPAGLDDTD